MMDVFPTDWSPRKTSLYFARGARVPAEGPFFVAGEADAVVGWAGRAGADAFSLIVGMLVMTKWDVLSCDFHGKKRGELVNRESRFHQ